MSELGNWSCDECGRAAIVIGGPPDEYKCPGCYPRPWWKRLLRRVWTKDPAP